ncbi:DivIVA domain-containing protein [uncultured Friedmanniella sp.]|uniref:DivIVA domain-containing protein n=1 Tax=uncultured Friedmanniella sp. TaxID=335381 RepID=UPI0035CB7AE5
MSLSLDDVRNKRFRMARKSGYEVLEVDEFVDEVEETFGQLFEENQNLKKQVEALKAAPAPQASAAAPAEKAVPVESAAPVEKAAPAEPPTAAAPSRPAGEHIVVTTGKEASSAVVRLVELTTQQSEQLVAEATAEAERIRRQAGEHASQVTTDAQNRAQKVEGDARTHAERLQADALKRAESLDRETETRRREVFGDLEQQRDQLSSTVTALRNFEATYRGNLTRHLQSQIEVLSSGREEPADPPAALANGSASTQGNAGTPAPAGGSATAAQDASTQGGGTQSDTPRLDALLGDQR